MNAKTVFALKWIMPNGTVHYYQTTSFTVVPMTLDDPDRPPEIQGLPKALAFVDGAGTNCVIDKGVVYIMGQGGGTIDTVNLPGPVSEDVVVEDVGDGEVLDPPKATKAKPKPKPRTRNRTH